MTPTVSIIMPCHNAEAFLPQSVGSAFAQTFHDFELIAVDDGSQDGTMAWLDKQTDTRLKVLSQPNAGASVARNNGLKAAQGRYVAFLDADDTWEPDFLEKMVSALDTHPDAVLAYCGWQNLGLPGGPGKPYIPLEYRPEDRLPALFANCLWPIHAALTRRTTIEAVGGFDLTQRNAEDYLLWLNIAAFAPIVRVPAVLAYYHFHDPAQQKSKIAPARTALAHMQAQLSFLRDNPGAREKLGKNVIRQHIYGHLLDKGYELYWQRNIPAARQLFRKVMSGLYGAPLDWKYMLPALLPLPIHLYLIGLFEKQLANRVTDKKS